MLLYDTYKSLFFEWKWEIVLFLMKQLFQKIEQFLYYLPK